jgi:hypothetical protein
MIDAGKRITLVHSTTGGWSVYESGMLSEIIDSVAYRRAVSRGRSVCTDYVYCLLCCDERMVRPCEWYPDMCPDDPHCRRVPAKASSYG